MSEGTNFLYKELSKLIAVAGYRIEKTSDGQFVLRYGNGLIITDPLLQNLISYAVEKSVEQFTQDRDAHNRSVMIEMGIPEDQIH